MTQNKNVQQPLVNFTELLCSQGGLKANTSRRLYFSNVFETNDFHEIKVGAYGYYCRIH